MSQSELFPGSSPCKVLSATACPSGTDMFCRCRRDAGHEGHHRCVDCDGVFGNPPTATTTLSDLETEKRRIDVERWGPEDCFCGACGQRAQVYKRKLYGAQAVALLSLVMSYLERNLEWFHVRSGFSPLGGDFAKLQHWGFIETRVSENGGGTHSGEWRPTPNGVEFARNITRVPYAKFFYNGCVIRDDDSKTVNIRDVLPEDFDYAAIWKS